MASPRMPEAGDILAVVGNEQTITLHHESFESGSFPSHTTHDETPRAAEINAEYRLPTRCTPLTVATPGGRL